ncbi:oligosaccharide flippase family protein [Ideonella sp.]|uniref:oligosaccharide flippase family protein n=1 Tax=Ideonella sp. TaxID=1929293 RepID=UPI0037BFBAFE
MPSPPPSVRTAKQGFVRAIAVLVGGTAAAHAVTALAMPILSRLYDPADFGALAVLTAIVSTIGVVACLRYDVAVALPRSDEDSLALLTISLASAAVAGLLACAVVAVFFDSLVLWFGEPALDQGKWLIPIGIFCFGAWNALQSWHIRQQNFGSIAKARLGQALATSSVQAISATMGAGTIGLLAGPAAGFAASLVALIYLGRDYFIKSFAIRILKNLKTIAKQYIKYPLYSTLEAFSNQAASQVPIVIIAATLGTTQVGHLALAMLALQAPMSLLGSAVGQVYLSRAPEEHQQGKLGDFTSHVIANLVKVGAGPILAIGIISPSLFPVVFGSNWEAAAVFVTWMAPWFFLQFIASPISMALHVVGAQGAAMGLQVFALVIRVGATWGAGQVFPTWMIETYILSGAFVYFIYTFIILKHLQKINQKTALPPLNKLLLWISPWLLASVAAVIAVGEIQQ